ncbi:MAG: outer membrane protein assembly factor, partial [Erythrobacter sp.]|nr:outer membrane protein assembly factor [Erythrobacter sp.]
MVSPSSFREAEPQRILKLGLAIAAGLGHAGLALLAAPAAAQTRDDDAAAVEAVPPPPSASQAALEPLPVPPTEPEPGPAEVPRSLDDLIPAEAVTNPDAWAAAGTGNVSRETNTADGAPGESLADFLPTPDPALQPAIDAAFAEFDIAVPERLEPDAELESLASLTAPVLGELPELEETQINSTLVLALPAAEDAFPERRDFITRFRALSTLRQLDDGDESGPLVAARARADAALLGNILRTYGYYDGDVVRQLSGGRRARDNGDADLDDVANEPRVRFDILPGTRYRFGRVALGALPALAEPDATRLMAAFGIKPGDPLYADRIVEREIELRVALGETGYPFATLAEPELLIDHARAEGDLTLDVQPGGKYVFGNVVSGDERFLSSRHLQRIARFDSGDVFQQSLETDLRRAIIATGLVSSVTITPR